MQSREFFDVLNVQDDNGKVDIIQSLIGSNCLGSYINNDTAKLYFQGGLKNQIETQLIEINSGFPFKWKWEKQNKEDWHLMWQDNFQPMIVDAKLAIIPHWQLDSPEDIVIKIKPGMAFGTGHHETTWLMLSQILKYIKPGMSILDLGTGSGILSIASIKLGAGKVDAVENDPDCIINFNENLKLNNITEGVQYYQVDALNWNHFNYDLILANINRKVIEKLIAKFKVSKRPILLSGLLKTDYSPIEKMCIKHQLQVKEKNIKGEWICILILTH